MIGSTPHPVTVTFLYHYLFSSGSQKSFICDCCWVGGGVKPAYWYWWWKESCTTWCIKPCTLWDICHVNWCRISSINSIDMICFWINWFLQGFRRCPKPTRHAARAHCLSFSLTDWPDVCSKKPGKWTAGTWKSPICNGKSSFKKPSLL